MINYLRATLPAGVLASLVISGLGLTNERIHTEYFYKSGTAFQRLETGHSVEPDIKDRTIVPETFTNTANWTTVQQSYTLTTNYTSYIGSISFPEEVEADGGADGLLTLQEALQSVYNNYAAATPNAMSPMYFIDSNAIITVMAANDAH
jgi:hypothetical protein